MKVGGFPWWMWALLIAANVVAIMTFGIPPEARGIPLAFSGLLMGIAVREALIHIRLRP